MLSPDYARADDNQRHFSLPPGSLAGKVVLITGASGGLGTALSLTLAAAGATLVLVGRSEKKLNKLYDVVVESGAATPALVPLPQETAAEGDYLELMTTVATELGGLDALVHASAVFVAPMPMQDVKQADWQRAMNVNVSAARLATIAALPLLQASSLGSVTFLLDHRPGAYWGAYGISKQAVHGLMHMLDDENEGQRDPRGHPLVAINGYDPGPMRTPLRRRAFPGELERESPLPATKLGPLLGLLSRQDRALTGSALRHD